MIQKNAVVLYKNQPAVITETGEKYTITFLSSPATKTGKAAIYGTQKARDKDIILLHSGPVESIQLLYQNESNEDFITNIQAKLVEAWELLCSDDETASQPLSVSDLAELSIGNWSACDCWAFYKILLADCHFAQKQDASSLCIPSFIPRIQSEVDSLLAQQNAKSKETENRQNFIKRLKNHQLQLPEDAQSMQDVESLALGKSEKSKTMKEAGFAETPEKAHKLLIDCKVWPIYKNPYPTRLGLSTSSATESLPPPPVEERTLIKGNAFAIDSEWSHAPDDAIAFDGTYVWIHIADPASAVLPDSLIDIAARNRGATLYIPEGAARMLAEESLEDYALGLREADTSLPESERLSKALSFRLLLDENGAITDTAVIKSYIHVTRLTYTEADLKKDSAELAPLFAIATRNESRRNKAGAVNIQLPEVHISVAFPEEATKSLYAPQVSITPVTKTLSSTVVREFMLLAGEGAAKFAFKNKIAFPFISQESPDIPNDIPEGYAGQFRLRRCMRSRSVGVTPSQHAGLGIGMYSQVTSPLRRYGDLVAHQQLRAFIDNKPLLDKDAMLEKISAGDAAGSASVKAERKSNLHWTLVYLSQHPDWQSKGIAVDYKGKQTVFLIPELGMETTINTKQQIELNSEIIVKAGNINIPELTVTFQEV